MSTKAATPELKKYAPKYSTVLQSQLLHGEKKVVGDQDGLAAKRMPNHFNPALNSAAGAVAAVIDLYRGEWRVLLKV